MQDFLVIFCNKKDLHLFHNKITPVHLTLEAQFFICKMQQNLLRLTTEVDS